ncbi:MAG: hypothetical protein GXP46_08985 [Deferribacteres bacterium]|nr:hypothetical protein [Deferribacteres bacterium]
MSTTFKGKDIIRIKQYVTDKRGHKIAAILDIDEIKRLEELLEDVADLKVVEDRIKEPVEDYEAYSRKRKSRL